MAIYKCRICGAIYDEEKEGKPLSALDGCPVCKMAVSNLIPVSPAAEPAPPKAWTGKLDYDAATARQDSVIYINEATAYQNTIVPQARADAYQQVAEAEGYREETIKTAQGDADLFSQRQEAYASYPRVTRFRLYMEAMEEVLPNVQKLLLGGNVSVDNAELWLGNGSK